MANEENLIKFTKDQSREEAKKNGRKGGINSGISKRKKKATRLIAQEVLATVPNFNPMKESDRALVRTLQERYGVEDLTETDIQKISMLAVGTKAMKGNENSLRFLLEQANDEAWVNIKREQNELERQRIEQERERIALERERIALEREKIAAKMGGNLEYDPNDQMIEMYKMLDRPVENRKIEDIEKAGAEE